MEALDFGRGLPGEQQPNGLAQGHVVDEIGKSLHSLAAAVAEKHKTEYAAESDGHKETKKCVAQMFSV